MTDHDSLYHRLFGVPVMVEQLVRDFVPQVDAAGFAFDRMTRIEAKFHGPRGERREGDVIWRLPAAGGNDLYLCLLLEFQSRTDWWMAVRAQVYEGLLWQQLIAEQVLRPGDRLPPVLLLVLYNGEPRWTAPTCVAELIGLPPESPLWPWQPQVRYHLLDMGAFPGDELARRDSLAALLFRLEQRCDKDDLIPLIDEVVGWFRQHPGYDEIRRLFTELVRQAVAGVGTAVAIPESMTEMRTMLATLGESWKQQWKAEGLAEGLAKGLAKGLAEGLAEGLAKGEARLFLRLAEKRFGPLTGEQRDRILAADTATLEAWTDRILDEPTLNALLGISSQ